MQMVEGQDELGRVESCLYFAKYLLIGEMVEELAAVDIVNHEVQLQFQKKKKKKK